MKHAIRIVLGSAPAIAIFLGSVSTPPLHAAIIINGSFEMPIVPAGGFTDYANGSMLITGWTVVGGAGVSLISGTASGGGFSFPAQDAAQWLDLTGDGSNSTEGVEQTFSTLFGTQYSVSFWIGNVVDAGGINGTSSSVKVLLGGINGTSLGIFTNSTGGTTLTWQKFTTMFTAGGSTSTLDFVNQDPSNDNVNGLDNVAVSAIPSSVPEPGTLWLVSTALVGVGLLKRRLKRKATR